MDGVAHSESGQQWFRSGRERCLWMIAAVRQDLEYALAG